jgi:hypoxanthine-guanine phosphoribosyltransferase
MLDWARRQRVRTMEVCTLFDRREARLIDLDVRYAAFDAPEGPVAGFGIGRDEALASLPHIVSLQHG